MAENNEKGWVDELVAKLEGATNGVLEVEVGGEKVSAFLGDEVVQYFKTNRILLLRLGKDLFRSFLMLIHEKKEEQAFNLLLSKMEADELIARMKMNAAALNNVNDDHDAFIASLKKFVTMTLTQLTSKIIIGLLI